jgi:hypothetical protein
MSERAEGDVGPDARMRGCPPPEQLTALAGDALPEDLRREVAVHLAGCQACQALAEDLSRLDEVDAVTGLEQRVLPPPPGRGRWAMLVAAAVLAAIGASAWWRAQSPEPSVSVADSHTSRPAPAPPASPPRWTIEKPALVLPATTVLVMRGSDPAAAALASALEPYRRGDFQAAASSLGAFASAHPDSADGWFYLGASQLLIDRDAYAREALEKAASLGAGSTHPELEWLRATAEARTGATDSARGRLTALCGASGPLKDRACSALKSLP